MTLFAMATITADFLVVGPSLLAFDVHDKMIISNQDSLDCIKDKFQTVVQICFLALMTWDWCSKRSKPLGAKWDMGREKQKEIVTATGPPRMAWGTGFVPRRALVTAERKTFWLGEEGE